VTLDATKFFHFLKFLKYIFKYFCSRCLYFSFSTHNNAYQAILYTTALLSFPKNIIPWRDSNQGFIVPKADAMSSAPRRQGNLKKGFLYGFYFHSICTVQLNIE
jgi:hypothetical protein